jgi:hypothetical protein
MKTKLLLCVLAFALMSSTCSNDDALAPSTNDCTCKKVYYDYGVVGWGMGGVQPIWGYTFIAEETATQMDCNLATGQYVQLDSNSYYKIECQ